MSEQPLAPAVIPGATIRQELRDAGYRAVMARRGPATVHLIAPDLRAACGIAPRPSYDYTPYVLEVEICRRCLRAFRRRTTTRTTNGQCQARMHGYPPCNQPAVPGTRWCEGHAPISLAAVSPTPEAPR